MYAEHLVGLTALEYARLDNPQTAANVRDRYLAIRASGELRARGRQRDRFKEAGNSLDLDHLAGDDKLIFLSYGPRYRASRPTELCYGFVFDAEQLVRECGAHVGPDLLDDYEALLEEVVREIDARLSPLAEVSVQELASDPLFADEDADLLAAVAADSRSRFWEITDAVMSGDVTVEGAAEALTEFKRRVAELQAHKRVADAAALAACESPELTLHGPLPLSRALGVIEAGEIRLF